MQLLAQVPKIIPLSVLVAVVLSGCDRGPVSECNSLIALANRGSDVLTNVDLNDREAVEQKANSLQQISQELDTLPVSDRKLQEFRRDLVQIYQTYSDTFSQTQEAIDLVSNPLPVEVTVAQVQQAKLKVERSRISIRQTAQQAELLSRQINDYCPVPKQ